VGTIETDRIEDLVRILVRGAPPSNEQRDGRGDCPTEEIILDLEVDEARYLLIRLPKRDRNSIQLSPREREIVRLVAQGHSNKIIADVLSISSWTVSTHLRRIFAKLGVGSRAAMVAQVTESPVHNRSSRSGSAISGAEMARKQLG
jgi:DNA-binding CsgD family transcriptional regulator